MVEYGVKLQRVGRVLASILPVNCPTGVNLSRLRRTFVISVNLGTSVETES